MKKKEKKEKVAARLMAITERQTWVAASNYHH
jgi:hypothetical protein